MSTCTALIKTPADRLYYRRCQIGVALSLVLYIALSQASLHFGRTAVGAAFSLLAGAAFFAEGTAVALMLMKRLDEFQRTLMIRSFLWATFLTMFLSATYGSFELHMHDEVPHVPVLWVPAVLIMFTAAAKLLIFRQYRSPAEHSGD